MHEQFVKNIKIIKAAIAGKKLVVFCGAGISVDSGVPSWNELIKEFKKDIDIPTNENDYLRIAQLYYNERQQKEFIDKVREVLQYKKLRYNEIHEEIFELNPEHIITTNFEDLLEQVIKSKAYPYSVIKKDAEFPYASDTKLLVKMHGDLDEGNLVIKEEDYLDYSESHPLIESFIKGIFATKVVLFIGYSFSDLNLKIIVQNVRNILGRDFQNAYLLSVEKEFHPVQRQYLWNKGINVINYYDGISSNSKEKSELYNGVPIQTSLQSEEGNRLLHFLKIINAFNDFAVSLQSENLLTQMFKSLNRFNNIKVLPPNFLSNLYPFNITKNYIFNYSDNVLGSSNNKVVDFFFENIFRENLKLDNKFFEENLIPELEQEKFNKQLLWVLEKLNFASIFYFGRNNSKIELFEYPKELNEKINILLPNKSCNCISCLYYEFNLNKFLISIKEETLTETSELQFDLQIAYSNYKAGNFNLSINQFEEIASKAWQLGEYISYFISKNNIKNLRNLLNWDFEEKVKEKRKAIIEKIDKLDLDKLMVQIPKLNDDVYKLLKIIRDDQILIDSEKKVNDLYDKILGVYNSYKKGGSILFGPDYSSLIIDELTRTYFFYSQNYIVRDIFSDFKHVFEKGLHALFISFATSGKYQSRFTKLDSSVVRLILLFADSSELIKVLEQYSIKEIAVEEKYIYKVFKYLTNIFESIFTENKFGGNVELTKGISIQTKSFFFQQWLRNTIHNAFLIIGIIPFTNQYGKPLIRKILDFLKVDNMSILADDKPFNKALNRIIEYLSFEEILELLQICISKDFLNRSGEFYKIISEAIQKFHTGKTIDEDDLIDLIIKESIIEKFHKHERGFMHLWKVCSERNRQAISKAIIDDLSDHFYSIDYFTACYLNVIEPDKLYSKILAQIEGRVPDEFPIGVESIIDDLTLINFIWFIYSKEFLSNEIPYSNFDDFPDYIKFYFRPFAFDYSKFDVQWLFPLKSSIFFKHLKRIPDIKNALKETLKIKFDEKLSEIYCRYFI